MNPYAPPNAGHPESGDEPKKKKKKKKRGGYSARLEAGVLIVSRDAELPDVCLKCGTHDEIMRRKANFQWTPLWARMLLPFCALGGLIAMSITRKHASLSLPLCVSCDAKWTAARNATIAGVVPLIGAFLYLRITDDRGPALAVLIAAVAGFVALMLAFVRPRMMQSTRIDAAEVHLKGFDAGAGREVVDASD